MQLHSVVVAQRAHEPADGDAEPSLVEPHEAHNVATGGFGSVSSGCGGIHAGRSELMFTGSSLSATSCSNTAAAAVDFPHDNGSWTSNIASNCRGMWESKLYSAKVRSRSLLLPPLALGSGLKMQGRRRKQGRRVQKAR